MTEPLYYTTHASTIGDLIFVASARGLRYLNLLATGELGQDRLVAQFGASAAATITELPGFFSGSIAAIDQYLNEGTRLKLPVDLAGGTPLQRSVWIEMARIPYGETISYSMLADRVGFPRAVRAVASACGANPLPLVIPCHRVVAKDGTLGGFSLGGLDVKEYLLANEQRDAKIAA